MELCSPVPYLSPGAHYSDIILYITFFSQCCASIACRFIVHVMNFMAVIFVMRDTLCLQTVKNRDLLCEIWGRAGGWRMVKSGKFRKLQNTLHGS